MPISKIRYDIFNFLSDLEQTNISLTSIVELERAELIYDVIILLTRLKFSAEKNFKNSQNPNLLNQIGLAFLTINYLKVPE